MKVFKLDFTYQKTKSKTKTKTILFFLSKLQSSLLIPTHICILPCPVFDLFLSKSCHGWPGPGLASDHIYTMNPAKEFVENHEAHVRWG